MRAAFSLIITCLIGTLSVFSQVEADSNVPELYEFVHVDHPPVAKNYVAVLDGIQYPDQALNEKVEGKVVCRVLVDKEGNYVDHVVLQSANRSLTEAVEGQVHKLTFDPARKGEKRLAYWVNMDFSFRALDHPHKKLEEVWKRYSEEKRLSRVEKYMQEGLGYLIEGNERRAIRAFSETIQLNTVRSRGAHPANVALFYAHMGRGKAWFSSEKWESAVKDFTEAIGIGTTVLKEMEDIQTILPLIYMKRGDAYVMLKQDVKALADFRFVSLVHEEAETNCEANRKMLQRMKKLGMYEQALATVKGEQFCATTASWEMEEIELTALMGKVELALAQAEALSQGVLSKSEHVKLKNLIGAIYWRDGNIQQALTYVQQANDLNPNDPDAYFYKGLILFDLEGYQEARENWEQAMKLGLGTEKVRELKDKWQLLPNEYSAVFPY
ncbi:MAG: TonB family protein [Bacteroidota bacterium]